jgi:hypothetical protein
MPGMVSDERSEPHARTGRSRANRGPEHSEGPQRRAARAEWGGPNCDSPDTSPPRQGVVRLYQQALVIEPNPNQIWT